MAKASRAGARAGAPLAWLTGLVVGFSLFAGTVTAAQAAPVQRETYVVRVIDGDTFQISGGVKVRVRNFDTPELRRYECPEEKQLARAATIAARQILQGKSVALSITGKDRYGRLVADVTLHEDGSDIDFTEAMMAQGHGAPWDYGHEPQPDWCASRSADAGTPLWQRVLGAIAG
ncbi:MAG: thermonuclease family protein [Neomegalonema sp.]|nr:thermonuclease family protein [Neomegalonema sp.]